MKLPQWFSNVFHVVLAIIVLNSSLWGQAKTKTMKHQLPTAEEVSRRVLSTHPKPRDEAEKRIIAVMEAMYVQQSRGMGNVLPEDGRLMKRLVPNFRWRSTEPRSLHHDEKVPSTIFRRTATSAGSPMSVLLDPRAAAGPARHCPG